MWALFIFIGFLAGIGLGLFLSSRLNEHLLQVKADLTEHIERLDVVIDGYQNDISEIARAADDILTYSRPVARGGLMYVSQVRLKKLYDKVDSVRM